MNNKSAVSFHPQDKSSGSHSTLLKEGETMTTEQQKEKLRQDARDAYDAVKKPAQDKRDKREGRGLR